MLSLALFCVMLLFSYQAQCQVVEKDNMTLVYVSYQDDVELNCIIDFYNSSNSENETNIIHAGELETNATIFIESSEIASNNPQEWRLIIFKKDNILVQLQKSVYSILIDSKKDGGMYECGFYYMDIFGNIKYNTTMTWFIEVISKSCREIKTIQAFF